MARKVIVTVAPTGGFQGKEANPNIPLQPAEIADDVYNAWNEGASIVHIHCRDKQGKPTQNPEIFADTISRIRGKGSDIITQATTGGGPGMSPEERIRSIEAGPE